MRNASNGVLARRRRMIDRYCANCRHLKKGAKNRYECDLCGVKVRCPFFATCAEFEAKGKDER